AGTNTPDTGRPIATPLGPQLARNTVVANGRPPNIPSIPPGAIYLATDPASDPTFKGSSLMVDGNDRKMDGTAGTGAPVPGIATRNDTNAQETRNSLTTNQQKADVQGTGYLPGPPPTPSIAAVPSAPSVSAMDRFITDLLARP